MKQYYQIYNKVNEVEILIYEQIGTVGDEDGITAKNFANELKSYPGRPISVRINSPGGNLFEGITIYNILKNHNGKVTVYVDGIAASAASLIAMAGTVSMPGNAMMMIHDPMGVVIGGPDDMDKHSDLLRKLKGTIVSVYHDKTNLPRKEIEQMMTDETWFTASEAKEKGFADVVTAPADYQANFQLLKDFSNTPKQLLINRTINMGNTSNKSDISFEEYCRNEWNTKPEIRHEFFDFDTYQAYMQLGEEGQIQGVQPIFNKQPVAAIIDDETLKQQCRARWDASPELKHEFLNDFELYFFHQKGVEDGSFKEY